jgi:hypothetical protein
MGKQENKTTIKEIQTTFDKIVVGVLNVIWAIIQVLVIFSVIALLYINDFIGVSIIIYNLLRVFAVTVVAYIAIKLYLMFIEYCINKGEIKRAIRHFELKEDLKKEIIKEMKNGRKYK